MIRLKVLGSSSSGNCYLIETEKSKLILDAGVNFKNVQKALKFDFKNIEGVLITHEHMDHLKYATNFALNRNKCICICGNICKAGAKRS